MDTNKISELRRIAQEIENRRLTLGLSKNVLCQKFGQLGSTKTFGRMLDAKDALEELNLDRQLENYQAALELVLGYDEDPEELKIYSDFGFVRRGLNAVSDALQETDITRFVLVTAGSGGGKSAFLDLLQSEKKTASITYRVEATEAWRSKISDLLGALLMEVGMFDRSTEEERARRDPSKELPQSSDARLRKLIERLDSRRVILAIDEGHHIGAEGYNIVKTIINQTRAVVVMTAIPEIIARINKKSHSEAQQLFTNRLSEHVRLGTPEAGDVLEFLKRRGIKFATAKDASAIADKISKEADSYGLWKYVKRCARYGRKEGGGPFNQNDFVKVIVRVKNSISLGG